MIAGVVGCGLAGLRAATLLERAGVEVRLFEARPRPGGRVVTVNDDAGRPLYEAGGEWIDAEHGRVLGLLAEHGLEARPRPAEAGKVFFRGEETTEDELWPDARADETAVEELARSLCRDLTWDSPRAAELDGRSVAEFLAAEARSERGRFWLDAKYRADEGDDLTRVGLAGWLVGFLLYAEREGGEMCAFHLPISGSELCARMLSRLAARPELGRVLSGVRQGPGGVTLEFTDGTPARVDAAILALPPPCVLALDLDLPPRQRAAMAACRMGRAVKLCLEFSEPWWRAAGWSGALTSDGPLQQTWDASIGERPVLAAYAVGEEAAAWTRRADPVAGGLAELERLCPGASRTFVGGRLHDWVSPPHTGGVHSHYQPGFVTGHLAHLATPAGRVCFAGEHTAVWSGFMEGALESGERAAREVLA